MGAPGSAPGSAVYTGEARSEPVTLDLVDYGASRLDIREGVSPQEAASRIGLKGVTWVDANGIHDVPQVKALTRLFGIHPLSVEDIVDTETRTKAEYYDDYLYVVVRMVTHSEADGELATEQVSLLLGADWVLTFQERKGDVWGRVRQRIRDPKTRVRQSGADYLAYALLDAIVDDYTIVLDRIEEEVDVLDALDPADMPSDTPLRLHRIKRRLRHLRKLLRPLKEAVTAMLRSEGWIDPTTVPYLRDLSDNLADEMEQIDLLRETCGALLDLFTAHTDHALNEEMRVLTVMATIFIPMTFITGFYGMNFDHMPELHLKYGYPIAITAMVGTALGMLWYFRRKGWI